MPAKDHWYQHVPPATARIPCEGEQHRITWRWGKLKLDDHDLGSERAMLVLGGEPSPCLLALQLWADQFGLRPEHFEEMRRRLGGEAVLLPEELNVPRDVGMALSLERAWKRSRYLDMQGRMLERHVRERALPALKAHLNAEKQRLGSRIVRGAQVRHVRAGSPVMVEGRMDKVSVSATVALSSDWVVHVWPRGLAVTGGALVVEVTGRGPEPGSAAVRAVRWFWSEPERRVAEPAIVSAVAVPTEDGWRLNDEERLRGGS